jgi:hypothetical protein
MHYLWHEPVRITRRLLRTLKEKIMFTSLYNDFARSVVGILGAVLLASACLAAATGPGMPVETASAPQSVYLAA